VGRDTARAPVDYTHVNAHPVKRSHAQRALWPAIVATTSPVVDEPNIWRAANEIRQSMTVAENRQSSDAASLAALAAGTDQSSKNTSASSQFRVRWRSVITSS
jgi:hypothetical protein